MSYFDNWKKAGADLLEAASSSLNRFAKVEEVTGTKNDNIPVYALNELVQICNREPDDATAVAQALLKKVSSTNAVIKWKALKSIRYICQNTSSTVFKRECGGVNAAPIREALSWSGRSHPQYGQSQNTRVRDAAKECLEEVFRSVDTKANVYVPPSTSTNGANPNLRSRIQGYGSTTGPKIANTYDNGSTASTGGGLGSGTGTYKGFGSDDVRAAESQGAAWSTFAPPRPTDIAASSRAPAVPVAPLAPKDMRAAIGDEASVVSTLCSTGGVRPNPTPAQLSTFVNKVTHLDVDVVAVELTQQLTADAWQSRVRALSGMHAIASAAAQPTAASSLTTLATVLRDAADMIAAQQSHSNGAVRSAATAALAALGITATSQAAASNVDLLGGVSDEDAAATASSAAPGQDQLADLFGGGEPGPSTEAQVMVDDGLGGLGDTFAAPSAATPPPGDQHGGVEDLLGGLDDLAGPDMHSATTVQVNAAANSAPPPPVASGMNALDDMFGSMNVAPPVASAQYSAPPEAAQSAAAGPFDLLHAAQGAPHCMPTQQYATPGHAASNGWPASAASHASPPPPQQSHFVNGGQHMGSTGMPGSWAPAHPAQSANSMVSPAFQKTPSAQAHATMGASGGPTMAMSGSNMLGSGQLGASGYRKPKDAFDFVNDVM